MVDPADWMRELARDDDVRSIALYLEGDGDGALLCEALAECAERGVGVAVLKVGESTAGAAAATAHTGALAGDQRVFRALVEEAGAAWAADVHDLLELAKALGGAGQPRRRRSRGLTPCRRASAHRSPAPGGLRARRPTSARGSGCGCRSSRRRRPRGCAICFPTRRRSGNPLDYTALIWGDTERLRDIIVAVGDDPAIDRVLVFYDQAARLRPRRLVGGRAEGNRAWAPRDSRRP